MKLILNVLGISCLTILLVGILQGQENQLGSGTDSELSEMDQLQIWVQKICPVSGEKLGTKGDPVKILAGEQIAFLCCPACQGRPIDADHWKTIQGRIAQAQGICPIMEKAVNADMKSIVINGQRVFVCCPPCIPKIQSDPVGSFQKVKASYVKFMNVERTAESERIQRKAQGICPVSGKQLADSVAPFKVKFGEQETGFLCCQDCVGSEIKAEHWQKIQENMAHAQGVCPVMEKSVDSSMESVTVNGRKIFVCCPPCIKKIKAEPRVYVEKLDAQIGNAGKPVAR